MNEDLKVSNCPTPSGYFVSKDGKTRVPAPCRSWSCPVCGQVKKNRVMDIVHIADAQLRQSDMVPNRKIWRFLTLTQRTDDPVPIMKAWARFRALAAKHNVPFDFFLVKEFTVKGKRHLHVLINRYIKGYDVKKWWWFATEKNSFVIKIVRRDIKNAAGYMTKYMTKAIGVDNKFVRGERRYTSSQRFFKEARMAFKFTPAHEFSFEYRPHFGGTYKRYYPIWKYIRYHGLFSMFDREPYPPLWEGPAGQAALWDDAASRPQMPIKTPFC